MNNILIVKVNKLNSASIYKESHTNIYVNGNKVYTLWGEIDENVFSAFSEVLKALKIDFTIKIEEEYC